MWCARTLHLLRCNKSAHLGNSSFGVPLVASMDARDILGIDPSQAGPSGPKPRASKPQIKKPEGMSREVFALLVQDPSSAAYTGVPLVPTPAPDAGLLKEKKTRVVGWEWRDFTNAARSDGLVLRHWSKLSDKSTTYTFSRFNKAVKVLEWTDEEYDQHLTHPAWDRTESALLFDLWCARVPPHAPPLPPVHFALDPACPPPPKLRRPHG
jgi:DNA methyltransferase 1-associated protein 1